MTAEKEKRKEDNNQSRKPKLCFATPYLAPPEISAASGINVGASCSVACAEEAKIDESGVDDDDEICMVCKRWMPAELGVDIADKIVYWGQCMIYK